LKLANRRLGKKGFLRLPTNLKEEHCGTPIPSLQTLPFFAERRRRGRETEGPERD